MLYICIIIYKYDLCIPSHCKYICIHKKYVVYLRQILKYDLWRPSQNEKDLRR